MKMADLLRQLADRLDGIEGPATAAPKEPEQDLDAQPTMMSPLQQKLELLKKGVGVESEFDDEGENELTAIRKNAGISPAVIHVASDDEPLE
jgi:uncharacterized protein YfkK (UPF0435 family)